MKAYFFYVYETANEVIVLAYSFYGALDRMVDMGFDISNDIELVKERDFKKAA